MPNNLRVFNTYNDYNTADLVKPSVSYVVSNDKVYYDDAPSPSFQGKWLATYQDSHTESAECGSSSEIVRDEIYNHYLVSVEIGDYCVTSIGQLAFYGCSSLTSITIPDSVTTISDSAFNNCTSLTSCTIGDGVTSIGYKAFEYCESLTSIDIPDSVTSIGNDAFRYCTRLTSCTIGSGVTSIGNNDFQSCTSLTSCTIGDGVTSIGNMAFLDCISLQSIVIPSGVTSIGSQAFRYCTSLTSITVNATTPPTLGGAEFSNTNNCPIYVPSASVNAYKSAWSKYASRIQAIPNS